MTLSEFKAWFEGYTENMDGPPNAKQWKRIKSMIGDIDGEPITLPIYIDRYWNLPNGKPYETWISHETGTPPPKYCSTTAMLEAGRADDLLDNHSILMGKAPL